jgi:hypothetical protein
LDFLIGRVVDALVQYEGSIQNLIGDDVVPVHKLMAQKLRIPFGSLSGEGDRLSLFRIGERHVHIRRLSLPTGRDLGQRRDVLLHKPVSSVENLNALVLFLVVVVASDVVNASTFRGEFLHQLLIVILLPANVFTILADGAGLAEVTGWANIGILVYPDAVMYPQNEDIRGLSRFGRGIVVPCGVGDNVDEVIPSLTLPEFGSKLLFED